MMIFFISPETITTKSCQLNQKFSSFASFSAEFYNFKDWKTPKRPPVLLGLNSVLLIKKNWNSFLEVLAKRVSFYLVSFHNLRLKCPSCTYNYKWTHLRGVDVVTVRLGGDERLSTNDEADVINRYLNLVDNIFFTDNYLLYICIYRSISHRQIPILVETPLFRCG